MNFSSRLRAILIGLAMACLTPAAPPMAQASPREVTDLSTGWHFRFGDAPEAVTAAGFDDSGWEQVSVPHTWNRVGEYALARSAATNNAQGVGYYRLTFNALAAAQGRRQYLDFAAVAIIADVWVNGVHVGQHKGAFSRFRFDVTAAWKPGAATLIVVKADNSKPALGSSTADVLPLAGDFFIHGGMYRGVSLITANDVGIDLLDFGGPGVYVRSRPSIEEKRSPFAVEGTGLLEEVASVVADVRVRNASGNARSLVIISKIFDAEGTRLNVGQDFFIDSKEVVEKIRLQPGGSAVVSIRMMLQQPAFWSGLASPKMYTLTVDVREGKRPIDSVTQSFGIRDFKFDANTGFTLNGKPLKLHGVSRH
ncbi:MAG: hypothetical protein RLZZ366_1489, partial [Pseudomonadota bacterium]